MRPIRLNPDPLLVVASWSSTVRSPFAFAARAWATLTFTGACFVDRIGTRPASLRCFRIHDLAAVDPHLDADLSERGLRFRQTVIDVRAQSVQRQLSLKVPLTAGDLSAIQTATHLDLNSLCAETKRLFDGLSHRAAKSDALFELRGNLLGLQLRVQFRLVDLLDRNEHFTSGLHREIALEFVDLSALASDDDSRSRGIDDDLQTVRGSFDIDVRNAGARETLFQISFQFEVFEQELAELLFRKPMRVPVFVVAESKTVWMNFLTHVLLPNPIGFKSIRPSSYA